LTVGCIAAGLALAYAGAPAGVVIVTLVAATLPAWWLPIHESLLGYVATLGVQVMVGTVPLRICVGDPLMAAAITRTAAGGRAALQKLPLRLPLALFALALAIGTVVSALNTGGVSIYALLNKDLGAIYLIAGVLALSAWLTDRAAVERTCRWFVAGVSMANVTSLAAAVLSFAGVNNQLYLMGNMRLYGWMLNPNLFGSILLVAAMLELAMLSGTSNTQWRRWRWLNVALLAIGLTLTLSRGTWLAVAVAAMVLTAARIAGGAWRRPSTTVVATWAAVPTAAILLLASGGTLSPGAGQGFDYAMRLRTRFIEECRSNPSTSACADVQMPDPASSPDRPGATSSNLPELMPDPVGNPDMANAARQLTSSRGVDDRVAILRIAASDYSSSLRTMFLGTGLDNFQSRSVERFGLPLIIHNSFAWALFELGPIGLAAVVLLWGRTGVSLIRVWGADDWRRDLSSGLLAALAGLGVFCLLNDGLYQRHLWLIFVLAERMRDRVMAGAAAPVAVSHF
jgi:hypothetical protein